MLSSVKLHDQTTLDAAKVGNVGTYGMLATKFQAAKLSCP